MMDKDPFEENADLVRAMENAPPRGGMPVPPDVLASLEKLRYETTARLAGKRAASRRHVWLTLFAVLALMGSLVWFLLSQQPVAQIELASPAETTTDTRPRVAWEEKTRDPAQQYDVWILPGGEDHRKSKTLFLAQNVRSPVAFAQFQPGPEVQATELEPGQDYLVLVCLAGEGRLAGVPVPFRVLPAPKP